MANILIVPVQMNENNLVTVSSDNYVPLMSTANTYQVKLPGEDGKVGFLIYTGVAASSVSAGRIKLDYVKSSDGLGWQVQPYNSTGVKTLFMGPSVAASSSECYFYGPFESARYGVVSTLGFKCLNLKFDCSTGNTVTDSALSTPATNVYAAVKLFAFEMPG
jgi:hypothetical protein